jgi:hypothetical protein
MEVDRMLKGGIIWKLKFTWATPILLVDKPNKRVRFCVNYRKFNEIMKRIFIFCQELMIYLIDCLEKNINYD